MLWYAGVGPFDQHGSKSEHAGRVITESRLKFTKTHVHIDASANTMTILYPRPSDRLEMLRFVSIHHTK